MVAINKTVKPDFIYFGQAKVSASAWAQASKARHPLAPPSWRRRGSGACADTAVSSQCEVSGHRPGVGPNTAHTGMLADDNFGYGVQRWISAFEEGSSDSQAVLQAAVSAPHSRGLRMQRR